MVLSCLGISAFYELIEFAAGVASSEAAEAFIGTQGDNWDTQKDMLLALARPSSGWFFLIKEENEYE